MYTKSVSSKAGTLLQANKQTVKTVTLHFLINEKTDFQKQEI